MKTFKIAMLAAITFTLAACAGNQLTTVDRQVVTVPEFLSYIEGLTEEVKAADEDEFSEEQVSKAKNINTELHSMLDEVDDIEQLEDDKRDEVFDLSEEFYATIFPERNATRTVCRQEAPTGSRITETRCATIKDRNQRQSDDQQAIQRTQNRGQPRSENQ